MGKNPLPAHKISMFLSISVQFRSDHQRAHQRSVGRGILQRQTGDEQGLTVEHFGVAGGLFPVAFKGPLQGFEGGRAGIQLQHPLGAHALAHIHAGQKLLLTEMKWLRLL